MTEHHTLPKDVEARFDELLDDYSDNIYYDGDPKRSGGTDKTDLKQFLAQEIEKAEERGGRKAVEKCNICISEEAYKKILKAIENPPEPTQNLINAMKRYRKLTNPSVKEEKCQN